MIVELRELFDTIEQNDAPPYCCFPSDDEFPPQLEAFFAGSIEAILRSRPATAQGF
jgi:hypothetical protein